MLETLAKPWLALQCQMITGVTRGVVAVGGEGNGTLAPTAWWPDGARGNRGLATAMKMAMTKQRGVVHGSQSTQDSDQRGALHLACPFRIDGQFRGVAAIEIAHRPEPQQRAALQLLQWGCAWLEFLVQRDASALTTRLMTVVEIIASALEHEQFQAAATAAVNELATRLSCERVSLGFLHGKHARVHALSHSAQFGKKTNIIRATGAVMDEAIDQGESVVYPVPGESSPRITRAHAQLARRHGSGALLTIPLSGSGRIFGALTLERPADLPFDQSTVELCESVAGLVGPVLETKRREDRSLAVKVWDATRAQAARIAGPGHLRTKIVAAALVAAVAYLGLATGEYRVTARSTLEGTVQRAVVSPQSGYLATANARAGDIVEQGQVLGALDDKDLKLERLKWTSRRQQLLKQYREALAKHDRTQLRILQAQLSQADAEIALLDEQLKRMRFTAPFDGIVVTGDLSQQLGSPVERGQMLFEIAPLDAYRVVMQVDEADISRIEVGQHGHIALSGLPGEVVPVTVSRIMPVATAEEGRNFFRVEATLDKVLDGVRPGMKGVAKIRMEERKLIWIWTHELMDWFRLWAWTWLP
ncbi:MAG: HlyD family efflux transporter periplasmic adaptor subunit [Gammaproteobacteria bacterium]|nr:HlyD family efflux transporter periplasmic adaptor subunit [Gammaproteobacteria bacterium]NIR84982.1 HlyD family efflux transporter periplasmic adaptor subunit [Gammaproteobacteria bacterium]NIR91831.1 HlyD family efflux transporter periplasmic adaptor subunit [Gammaproteobacteria bacterium]NIU06029.1 HlyD family efflux transporter periplasmic adaptor subunit [Gammaproteobacteria bacterium]NIV53076.1 HlyD family efflux transporter periplasmic adaptor subunit [Gammaproteobacteria bacterium]